MIARFVVGTGRCGSTLLTRMLDQHNELLGLNEVFTGLDWGRRFQEGPVTGAEVADILGTPNHVVDMVIGNGYDAEEITYRFGPDDRYRRGDPLPWILTVTMGHLSEHPDQLWDEVRDWLSKRPAEPIAGHYRALFAHLADRAGATAWIERSGSSVDYLGQLLEVFPEALVVHLHRDGREVALSMRHHPFYRLAVQFAYGSVPDGVDPTAEDALIRAWLDGDPPVELYGRYWSDQLRNGAAALASMPSERLLTVAFEDVVADPVRAVVPIAEFLDLPVDPGFADRAAALVRGVPPRRAPTLDAGTRARLDEACAAGDAVLAGLT